MSFAIFLIIVWFVRLDIINILLIFVRFALTMWKNVARAISVIARFVTAILPVRLAPVGSFSIRRLKIVASAKYLGINA